MKVRYPTRCARCGEMMQPGALAVRYLGGLWHSVCVKHYQDQRLALRTG